MTTLTNGAIGKLAYEAYAKSLDIMVEWENLPPHITEAWMCAATMVKSAVVAQERAPQEDALATAWEDRHPSTQHIMRQFRWSHLPPHLRETSKRCAELTGHMAASLPDGPELTAGLRKLLEAKDCFVRAAVEAKEGTE